MAKYRKANVFKNFYLSNYIVIWGSIFALAIAAAAWFFLDEIDKDVFVIAISLIGVIFILSLICNIFRDRNTRRKRKRTYGSSSGGSHGSSFGGSDDSSFGVREWNEMNDDADFVRHLNEITKEYGPDWAGYDPEAWSGDDPEAWHGDDPESFSDSSDIW